MASTITSSTLTVTVSESIILNNQPINCENQLSIVGVNEVSKRIFTVPYDNQTTLITFGAVVASGTFVRGNLKYLRITNKDNTNFIRIQVIKSSADEFNIKLDPGKSFMMGNTKESVSATGGVFTAFQDADFISAQADTAPVDIEMYIASI